eukprot:TRINITY_DN20422_c0_g1_i1.p1 TRINITY_DN20422_c0_g1~~TRINITY_DN20422_c0_g1_i1.p1  ORF type:complete len:198 (-),score=28.35 TRINITY_DN20422_c0_g1_i1:151-744(-)
MTMRSESRLTTDLDRQAHASLHHILRPEHHRVVDDWMRTATDIEKQGVLKLARHGEQQITACVGRPQAGGQGPQIVVNNWYHKKKGNLGARVPSQWPVRDNEKHLHMPMSRAMSAPWLMNRPKVSWEIEDEYEKALVAKPGGCMLKLRDSTELMAAKNTQRNQGTYNMFSGAFAGSTTTSAYHNRQALGYSATPQAR